MNISPYLNDKLGKLFPNQNECNTFITHINMPRPPSLYVNINRVSCMLLISLLSRRGIVVKRAENCDNMLVVVECATKLGGTPEFLDGYFYLMGCSSVYAVESVAGDVVEYYRVKYCGRSVKELLDYNNNCDGNNNISCNNINGNHKEDGNIDNDCEDNNNCNDSKDKDCHTNNTNNKNKRKNVNNNNTINILDICSAPGGKSISLSIILQSNNIKFNHYCMDINEERIKSLCSNIMRMGMNNIIVINDDGLRESKKKKDTTKSIIDGDNDTMNSDEKENNNNTINNITINNSNKRIKYNTVTNNHPYLPKMDVIILDVPCTGTNKECVTLTDGNLQRIISIQRRLILRAYDMLKSNGILLYSTCSVLVDENEMIVQYLIDHRKGVMIMENVGVGMCGMKGYRGRVFDNRMVHGKRIYPHVHDGDGFFYIKIRKCN